MTGGQRYNSQMNGETDHYVRCPEILLRAPAPHLKVWLALAKYCIKQTSCWPGIPKIAELTGYSQRQVQRILTEMKDKGLLHRETRNGKSDLLTPLTPTSPLTSVSPVTFPVVGGDIFGTKGVTSMSPELDNRSTQEEDKYIPVSPERDDGSAPVERLSPRKREKQTDPRIKICLDYYHDKHEEIIGETPHIIGGRDATIIKRLLNTLRTESELKYRLGLFLRDPLEWQGDRPQHSLSCFEKNVNRYGRNYQAASSREKAKKNEWLKR